MISPMTVLCAGFPLSGMMTVLLGVLLPFLARLYHLDDAQAGMFFALQFLAATAASAAYGWTAGRWPAARVVAVSYAWMAAGTACFLVGGLWAARTGVALYGLGLGWNIASVNLVAAQFSHGMAVRALNLLNMFWGAGAVAGPALAAWALQTRPLRVVMMALSLTLLAAAAGSLRLWNAPGLGESRRSEPPAAVRSGFPWAAFLFLFLYVGTENCISGWVPTLGNRLLGAAATLSALGQSAFWLAILLGRGLSAAWAVRRPHGWMLAGLLLAAAGTGVLLRAQSAESFLLAAALAGLGLAPQFPTAVALYQQRTGAAAATWMGMLLAGGGLGGAVLPPLVGVLADHTGSLPRASSTVLVVMAAMGVLLLWERRRAARSPG